MQLAFFEYDWRVRTFRVLTQDLGCFLTNSPFNWFIQEELLLWI